MEKAWLAAWCSGGLTCFVKPLSNYLLFYDGRAKTIIANQSGDRDADAQPKLALKDLLLEAALLSRAFAPVARPQPRCAAKCPWLHQR